MFCAICGCNDRENCKYAIASDVYVSAFKRALSGEKIEWTKNLTLASAVLQELELKQEIAKYRGRNLIEDKSK